MIVFFTYRSCFAWFGHIPPARWTQQNVCSFTRCWRAHHRPNSTGWRQGCRKSHLCFSSISDQNSKKTALPLVCAHCERLEIFTYIKPLTDLKKALVAHCETSLSQAALEQARIKAVAQACSSCTENSNDSKICCMSWRCLCVTKAAS